MKKALRWLFGAAVAAALLGGLTGCKSSDDGVTERPWNAPKSWETGLPAGMMEGR